MRETSASTSLFHLATDDVSTIWTTSAQQGCSRGMCIIQAHHVVSNTPEAQLHDEFRHMRISVNAL